MSVSASPSRAATLSSPSHAGRVIVHLARSGRQAGRLACLLVCIGALAACSPLVNTPTPLPVLDEAGALRDQVARHEAASMDRATQLHTKAASCAECQAAASSIIEGSKARLETIGGLWHPWPEDTPQSWVEQPTPVADAPLSPEAFAQWLAATARHDTFSALELHRQSPTLLSTEQVIPVLVLSASRALEGWDLADAYSIDLNSEAPQLAALIERASQLSDGSEGDIRTQWPLTDKDLSPALPSDTGAFEEALHKGLAESTQAAQAVRTWDCVAQTLPHLDLAIAPLPNAEVYADALLTRSTDLLGKGVADERRLRCELEASTASELAQQVLTADMAMALSPSAEVSSLGVELLLSDVDQWREVISSADLMPLLSR